MPGDRQATPGAKARQKLFWISWVQPGDDHRPLTFPPNKAILGWWCTGKASEGRSTLVALVQARYESLAREAILQDWPEALEAGDWRFFDETTTTVLSDRYPLSDWMKRRLDAARAAIAKATKTERGE